MAAGGQGAADADERSRLSRFGFQPVGDVGGALRRRDGRKPETTSGTTDPRRQGAKPSAGPLGCGGVGFLDLRAWRRGSRVRLRGQVFVVVIGVGRAVASAGRSPDPSRRGSVRATAPQGSKGRPRRLLLSRDGLVASAEEVGGRGSRTTMWALVPPKPKPEMPVMA